jgi:spermidine synthase
VDDAIDVIAYEPSAIGMVCLRRRAIPSEPGAFATEITVDHQFLMSSENTASERALATRALELHGGSALRVLVGGLGLGYTAQAALASPRVAAVEVVELVAPVVDWLARGWIPLAGALRADPRFAVRLGDVYAELAAPPAPVSAVASRRRAGREAPEAASSWDLVLIDVDHSPDERLGASSAAFYTETGLAAARRHLAPGGVLAVWSYAESSPFADALRAVFGDVRVESLSFENRVAGGEETNWLFLARDGPPGGT